MINSARGCRTATLWTSSESALDFVVADIDMVNRRIAVNHPYDCKTYKDEQMTSTEQRRKTKPALFITCEFNYGHVALSFVKINLTHGDSRVLRQMFKCSSLLLSHMMLSFMLDLTVGFRSKFDFLCSQYTFLTANISIIL